MFEIYERLQILLKDGELIEPELIGPLETYCAWASMNEIKDLKGNIEIYIKNMLEADGEPLKLILDLAEESQKSPLIKLLYLDEKIWDKLENMKIEERVDPKKREEMLKKLKEPGTIYRMIAVDPSDSKLFIHISKSSPNKFNMHYIMNSGIFLSVGENIDIEKFSKRTEEDLISAFKALSDENRLKIFRMLLEESMTTSQIAEKIGLTLSTVNHHLKSLISANLVGLEISSHTGKGAKYLSNKNALRDLFELLDL
ncbi:MAG: metalloregulator ArsR/SmtB family transcription factor [Tissierellia bacterium]|nr:metalloregulator ArsR/SmtB family transcription factor [Tissierellia bacterium]